MTYVYRGTVNECLNRWQKRAVRQDPVNQQSVAQAFDAPASEASGLEARQLLDRLWEKLDALDRQIVVMCFVDDLAQDEVATLLGVWRRTVGRRLDRIRKLTRALNEGNSAE